MATSQSSTDEKAAQAYRDAHRATVMSWVWWAQVPIVCLGYWMISVAAPIEKAILVYLAAVSIIANAVSYASKAQAAKAEAAGYENP